MGLTAKHFDATILGKGLSLATDWRLSGLNNNLLVVGAPGSGKSRNIIEPNVMQLSSSYVIVDPKGTLKRDLAPGLAASGYEVMVLDFQNPSAATCSWNPLTRATDILGAQALASSLVVSNGVSKIDSFWDNTASLLLSSLILATDELPEFSHDLAGVQTLMQHAYITKDVRQSLDEYHSDLDNIMGSLVFDRGDLEIKQALIVKDEDHCEKAARRLFEAVSRLAAALGESKPVLCDAKPTRALPAGLARRISLPIAEMDDKTRAGVAAAQTGENQYEKGTEAYKAANEVMNAIAAWRNRCKELSHAHDFKVAVHSSLAYELYQRVASSANRTMRSILVSLAAAIDQWRDPALLFMLADGKDAIDLETLGDHRTALFVVVPDTEDALYPLVGVFMQQMVDALVKHADALPDQRLAVPVRFILDDYATMCGGAWSKVDRWTNATRSRGIWWAICIQGLAQLDQMLGKAGARSLISACDTQVFVGAPNDLVTATYMAESMGDTSASSVLHCGTNRETVFMRGHAPKRAELFDPDQHPNALTFSFARDMDELDMLDEHDR